MNPTELLQACNLSLRTKKWGIGFNQLPLTTILSKSQYNKNVKHGIKFSGF